jgi:hypothetical protein
VPKNGPNPEALFFPLEQRNIPGGMGPSQPLHIILDKYLDDLAAGGRPAFQRPGNPAARGTVCAKDHT